jgi:hypothetical protein
VEHQKQRSTAHLNLTVNGVTYHATGATLAEAAAERERQLAAAEREARWRPTAAGAAYLEAYRRLAARERPDLEELRAELLWDQEANR